MQELNVHSLPLEGKVLIEASAGTGKTYTIGLIVLRLLLEKMLPIEKIVLITFTDAATAELKKKTAEKIRRAYEIWETDEGDDPDLTLIRNAKQKGKIKEKEANLRDAIARMDEMPVFTIHGFCKKMLSEFAYETGNFEEREIVSDLSDIKARIIADFWRKRVKNLDMAVELKPDDLLGVIDKVLNYPEAEYEGDDLEQSLAETDMKKMKYAIAYELAKTVRKKLKEEKDRLKVMSYSDMIEDCYTAIKNDKRKILQNAVKNRYEAILVDEFQDTDGLQFKIFDYLFSGSGKPFFMIGDPKQAIFRFRGGDIFAYGHSKTSAGKNCFFMTVNYRSEDIVLKALNSFFESDSFVSKMGDGIGYTSVACGKKDIEPIREKDDKYKSFVIWKGDDELKIQPVIIAEIKRLLSSGNFKPKDIAILLKSNNACLNWKAALSNERIPAIVRGASVFASESATFLRILLNAICYNNNIKYIRALLLHEFCGFAPKEIDENVFRKWTDIIHEVKGKWERHGLMNAIDFFMNELNLWASIAEEINGERNITNIRQIMELLNEEEIKLGRVPEKINNRFAALCKEIGDNDEMEEKLETDEDALKIMTIHKSKGLEFNIVFVPDIWKRRKNRNFPEPFVYHKDQRKVAVAYKAADVGASDAGKKEENEETARLLYVALTRVKHRLYVAYLPPVKKKDGTFNGNKTSPVREFFYEFCNSDFDGENIQIIDLDEAFDEKGKYDNLEVATKNLQREAKVLHNKEEFQQPTWTRTSFTGISKNFEHREYIPTVRQKIPAGKRMGVLLHSIFENLDFNAKEDRILDMIENKLGGFKEFSEKTEEGKSNKEVVKNWVNEVLNKKLPGGAGKLRDVKNKATELGFLMSSDKVDLQKIQDIMAKEKISFSEPKVLPDKYIKGAIDLVFLGADEKYYILDWKSNSLNDFSRDGMEEAMQHHGYHLQYYIYAVALKRWLEQTQKNFDFEKKFGGIYYIFVRGVNAENSNGIYNVSGADLADGIAKLEESLHG